VQSRRTYPPETKAQAVAALMAGEPPKVVSEQFDIPYATVRAWRDDVKRSNSIAPHEKRAELGELVAGYLEELLTTVAAQARFARDESWLRQQNASDLAIFHGVLVDKGVRILAALQPVEEDVVDV
jgi:transposase-like protein